MPLRLCFASLALTCLRRPCPTPTVRSPPCTMPGTLRSVSRFASSVSPDSCSRPRFCPTRDEISAPPLLPALSPSPELSPPLLLTAACGAAADCDSPASPLLPPTSFPGIGEADVMSALSLSPVRAAFAFRGISAIALKLTGKTDCFWKNLNLI